MRTKSFEPKQVKNFFAYLTDSKTGKTVVPPYLINSVSRPIVKVKKGKVKYEPLTMICYDAVSPSTFPKNIWKVLHKNKKCDITIHVMDPVGEIIEEWQIKKAKLKYANFDKLSGNVSGNEMGVLKILLQFKIKTVNLNY